MMIACPVCGRRVRCRVPPGGDGTAVRPYRHGDPVCPGTYRTLDTTDTEEA